MFVFWLACSEWVVQPCMYAHAHTCIHMHTYYIRTHTHMHKHTLTDHDTHSHVHIHAHTCTHIYTIHTLHTCAHSIMLHTCMLHRVHMHIYTTHTPYMWHMYSVYVCMCMYTCSHTHTIHTCIMCVVYVCMCAWCSMHVHSIMCGCIFCIYCVCTCMCGVCPCVFVSVWAHECKVQVCMSLVYKMCMCAWVWWMCICMVLCMYVQYSSEVMLQLIATFMLANQILNIRILSFKWLSMDKILYRVYSLKNTGIHSCSPANGQYSLLACLCYLRVAFVCPRIWFV